MIHRFKNRFTIEELCKLLEVSRSGYYKWLKRKDTPDRDEVIANLITECHKKAHRTYGYRRIKIWLLRETGLVINHKAVLRIMRKYNLLAIRKRKRFRHYECNTYTHYNNELNRNFKATRPNEKWVTDISYIQTAQGVLYLSMIKDLYDNSIVGYKYATQMPASLVIETVRAAVKNANVILDTVKGTEDGDGLIVRVYESQGIRGKAAIDFGFAVKDAVECNLMEVNEAPAAVEDRSLHFTIKPYEIKTFRVRPV